MLATISSNMGAISKSKMRMRFKYRPHRATRVGCALGKFGTADSEGDEWTLRLNDGSSGGPDLMRAARMHLGSGSDDRRGRSRPVLLANLAKRPAADR